MLLLIQDDHNQQPCGGQMDKDTHSLFLAASSQLKSCRVGVVGPTKRLVNFTKKPGVRERDHTYVEWLTQCGAGKKMARHYMSNAFSLPKELGV